MSAEEIILIRYDCRVTTAGSFKELELGPTGRHVAAQVRRWRSARGLSYAALATRLAELGWSIPILGLRRIEAGARRVSVDDLLALAVALEISPFRLLAPGDPGDAVSATAIEGDLVAAEVLAWTRDESGLSRAERLDYWIHQSRRLMDELEEWDRFEADAKNSAARKLASDRRQDLEAQMALAVRRVQDLGDG